MKLHQALHGYVDGHRLLSASLELRPADSKTLLILSDASGPSGSIPERGYLTGFSLPDSGYYALARTWPAPDMPRPGCVWTHTLLVELEDLAALESPWQLLTYFHRPELDSLTAYGVVLNHTPLPAAPASFADASIAVPILKGLYDQPRPVAIMADLTEAGERLLLSIWGQQWPRLRRNFRFCTQVSADRSTEEAPFDLQFFSARRRTQPAWRVDTFVQPASPPVEHAVEPWINCALDDLQTAKRDRLSRYLRDVAVDIAGGRAAFKPLTSIYLSLSKHDLPAMDRAYEIIDSSFANEPAATLKDKVAAGVLAALPETKPLLVRVLQDWDSLSPTTRSSVALQNLGIASQVLANLGVREVFDYLGKDDERRQLGLAAIKLLPLSALVEYVNDDPAAFLAALEHQPALLAEPALWNAGSRVRHLALDWIRKSPTSVSDALPLVVRGESGDFADEISRHVGNETIWRLLLAIAQKEQRERFDFCHPKWVDTATRDKDLIAQALSHDRFERRTLVAVARAISPDDVPNFYGEDPWFTAYCSSSGGASESGDTYLKAFLFARALGYRSRNQAELLSSTFEDLHTAALKSSIPDDAWQLFRYRMPSELFNGWDRADALRQTVVATFVDRRLWGNSFVALGNGSLFSQLAQIAAGSYSGRRYLRAVKQLGGGITDFPNEKYEAVERALAGDD